MRGGKSGGGRRRHTHKAGRVSCIEKFWTAVTGSRDSVPFEQLMRHHLQAIYRPRVTVRVAVLMVVSGGLCIHALPDADAPPMGPKPSVGKGSARLGRRKLAGWL